MSQPLLMTGNVGWEPLARKAGLAVHPVTPSEASQGLPANSTHPPATLHELLPMCYSLLRPQVEGSSCRGRATLGFPVGRSRMAVCVCVFVGLAVITPDSRAGLLPRGALRAPHRPGTGWTPSKRGACRRAGD